MEAAGKKVLGSRDRDADADAEKKKKKKERRRRKQKALQILSSSCADWE